MKIIELNRACTIVDDIDFERVRQPGWRLLEHRGRRYAVRDSSGTMIAMHRFILNASDGQEIDHRNGDGLDNRRTNLRFCSRTQNMQNRPRQRNNTTGYKGVLFRKDRGRWQAQIRVNGRKIVRQCATKEDAARMYDELATLHFGNFARLNF